MKSSPLPSPANHLPQSLHHYAGLSTKQPRLTTPPPSSPSNLSTTPPHPPTPTSTQPNQHSKPPTQRSLTPSLLSTSISNINWQPLNLPRSELSLPLTLPTGQTFRWRRTGVSQFTGVVGPHLISLRHVDQDPTGRVSFFLHHSSSSTAAAALNDYLNIHISLADLWRGFAAADPRFEDVSGRFEGGARVLRQDPVECVFQFLCSSNNNIGRIEKMVGVLSSFGDYLGTVGGFQFHEFPKLERLSVVSEQQLREAGFGYRAKYIVGAIKALQTKPGGGVEWLASLRSMELDDVLAALCTLPGVGPKVASCIALFSLDQHHAIPVDTHVWKIATRYFMPELAGTQLTPKLCTRVADAFVSRFGKYAGWAQTAANCLPRRHFLTKMQNLPSENGATTKLYI